MTARSGSLWLLRQVISGFRAKKPILLNTTVHAGESYTDLHRSYADVRSAILVMRADRIGHGYAATTDEATLELVLSRGVHVEACPAGGHGHLKGATVWRTHRDHTTPVHAGRAYNLERRLCAHASPQRRRLRVRFTARHHSASAGGTQGEKNGRRLTGARSFCPLGDPWDVPLSC